MIKRVTSSTSTLNCINFDCSLLPMNNIDQTMPAEQWTIPRVSATVAVLQTTPSMHSEKDVANFEIWHQQLAHCSEKRLRQMQKLVDGIPAFHSSAIPHVVTCRTCDVAKLRKAPRGRTSDDLETLWKRVKYSKWTSDLSVGR